jgi:hypothetical protein
VRAGVEAQEKEHHLEPELDIHLPLSRQFRLPTDHIDMKYFGGQWTRDANLYHKI